MLLWHTTVVRNRPSINRRGLLTSKSRGKLAAVWLHAAEQQSWAFLHVVRRHGGTIRNVVSVQVEVDDDDVKRSSVPGLFYTTKDVDPDRLRRWVGFMVVSESPLERKGVRRGR